MSERLEERMAQDTSDPSAHTVAETLVESVKGFLDDQGPQWAAAISYYTLLSLFPLLLGATALAAYFVDPEWAIELATNLLQDLIPRGTSQIEQTIREVIDARGGVGVLSLLALFWSGSRVFGAITAALNRVFDVEESYGFVRRVGLEFFLMATIGTLFVLAIASQLMFRWVVNDTAPSLLSSLVSNLIPAAILLSAFAFLYRVVPRREVSWRAALTGGLIAVILYELARLLFEYYLRTFANYNLIYGSLAVVVTIIFWAWIVGVILLLGGEIAYQTQRTLVESNAS